MESSAVANDVVPLTWDLPGGDVLEVLMVDDDEDDAVLVQDLLERCEHADFALTWRSTASDGLEAIRSGEYHACLVDYRLGQETGLDLIRNARRGPFDLPFILLTGVGGSEIDLEAMRAGAADYLLKSDLTPTSLERSLRYAVEQARARTDLLRLARRDPLTGLHNRISVEERIGDARHRAERSGRPFGVAVLDLDGFKAVNDTCGHAAGDDLLRIVGARLRREIRPCDVVGRIGGDEFVIVFEDLADEDEAMKVARRLIERIHPPYEIDATLPRVTASIGVALFPTAGESTADLLRSADEAMYLSKRRGKGRAEIYLPAKTEVRSAPMTASALLEARMKEELKVVFQPQLDLETGDIVGAEALARWAPNGGPLVSASEFVPQLEQCGAIADLDAWVLRQVVSRLAEMPWQRASVNISPVNLGCPGFMAELKANLPSDPSRLEVELTETALLPDLPYALAGLEALRDLGVRVALDDFGTGYSSLIRLRDLPIDTLKVDRTFVHRVVTDQRDIAIIEAITTLARRLRIDVVAEGIETAEQARRLGQLGIRYGQGYWFGQPAPASEL